MDRPIARTLLLVSFVSILLIDQPVAAPSSQPNLWIRKHGVPPDWIGLGIYGKSGNRHTATRELKGNRQTRFHVVVNSTVGLRGHLGAEGEFRTRLAIPRRLARIKVIDKNKHTFVDPANPFAGGIVTRENITAKIQTKGVLMSCVSHGPGICGISGVSDFMIDVRPSRRARERNSSIKARLTSRNIENPANSDKVMAVVDPE